MVTRGQVISFFIILVVILTGAWQALSYGGLREAKKVVQPAFIAQEPSEETSSGISFTQGEEECSIPDCPAEVPPVLPAETAFLLIDDGLNSPREFVLEVTTTTTALDLLQEACRTAGFALESEDYDFGVLVEAINNKRNSQGGRYWLCYINGEMPQLTADKIAVKTGDKIEFKFAPR